MALTQQEKDRMASLGRRFLRAQPKASPSEVIAEVREEKKDSAMVAEMKKLTDVMVEAMGKKEDKAEEKEPESPKVWRFKHKYDVYNKLIETVATAE